MCQASCQTQKPSGCEKTCTIRNRMAGFDHGDPLGRQRMTSLDDDKSIFQPYSQYPLQCLCHPCRCLAGTDRDNAVEMRKIIGASSHDQRAAIQREMVEQGVIGICSTQPCRYQLLKEWPYRRGGKANPHDLKESFLV